jgi:hypothetical protein
LQAVVARPPAPNDIAFHARTLCGGGWSCQ